MVRNLLQRIFDARRDRLYRRAKAKLHALKEAGKDPDQVPWWERPYITPLWQRVVMAPFLFSFMLVEELLTIVMGVSRYETWLAQEEPHLTGTIQARRIAPTLLDWVVAIVARTLLIILVITVAIFLLRAFGVLR